MISANCILWATVFLLLYGWIVDVLCIYVSICYAPPQNIITYFRFKFIRRVAFEIYLCGRLLSSHSAVLWTNCECENLQEFLVPPYCFYSVIFFFFPFFSAVQKSNEKDTQRLCGGASSVKRIVDVQSVGNESYIGILNQTKALKWPALDSLCVDLPEESILIIAYEFHNVTLAFVFRKHCSIWGQMSGYVLFCVPHTRRDRVYRCCMYVALRCVRVRATNVYYGTVIYARACIVYSLMRYCNVWWIQGTSQARMPMYARMYVCVYVSIWLSMVRVCVFATKKKYYWKNTSNENATTQANRRIKRVKSLHYI